ncbi:MAG TPA: hypothetical protein VKA26_11585 [Ignavibacteriaceae bacterium]|nr:hypothetical protein [Ignavibacteriaceae bacterium]
MSKTLDTYFDQLKKDETIFLNFLKAKFPVFHNSNFFFRDFQFGIQKFFEKKDIDISYPEAEKLAKRLADYFETQKLFIPVSRNTWKINYPEFVTKEPGDPL